MVGAIYFPDLLERLCSVLYLIIRGYLVYMATSVKRMCLGYVWGCTLFSKVRLDSLRLCELPFDVASVFGLPMHGLYPTCRGVDLLSILETCVFNVVACFFKFL